MRARVEAASKAILTDVMNHLDSLAYDAVHAGKPLTITPVLIDAGNIVNAFKNDEMLIFFEVLFKTFCQAQPVVHFVEFDGLPPKWVSTDEAEIQRVLAKLAHPSSKVRLHALQDIEARLDVMTPYLDIIRKSLTDPNAACRNKAAMLVAQLEKDETRGKEGRPPFTSA